jgi:hypothetical protein
MLILPNIDQQTNSWTSHLLQLIDKNIWNREVTVCNRNAPRMTPKIKNLRKKKTAKHESPYHKQKFKLREI